MTTRPVAAGELIRLSQEDYQDGKGVLELRVTDVGAPDGEWLELCGFEIAWNGERSKDVRRVFARTSTLCDPRIRQAV